MIKNKKIFIILISVIVLMAIIIAAKQIYEIVSNDKILDNDIPDINGSENQPSIDEATLLNLYLTIYRKEVDKDASTDDEIKYKYTEQTENNSVAPLINDLRYTNVIGSAQGNWYLYYKFEISMPYDVSLNNDSTCFMTVNGKDIRNQLSTGGVISPSEYEYKLRLQGSTSSSVNPFNVYDSVADYENKFFDFDEEDNIIGIKYYSSPNVNGIDRIGAGIIFNRNIEDEYKKGTAVFCAIVYKYSKDTVGTYHALTYQIEIKNNVVGFSTVEHESNTTKNIYAIDGNEFYQTGTTYNGTNIFQNNSQNIIDEWDKGKETATLKCSIGEYYDENNNLVISTKNNDLPMMFNIRDLVIPYIPIARGGTEPMSIRQDGKAKIFQITQVRPYFDGACWQEIMLQEYTGDNPSANKA